MSPTFKPAAPSADGLHRAFRVRAILRGTVFSPSEKAWLLAINAWPLGHLLGAAAGFVWLPWSAGGRALAAAAWLLAVPPLLGRLVAGHGVAAGECAVPSRTFFRWWAAWQLQMLFNRLPWIEEGMRLVPGLYSFWLRLWGARVGRLTLWSPGVRLYDRPLLRIGDDVVLGIDARLVGHLSRFDSHGTVSLTLGPVTLGDRTSVGGGAFLGPGFVLDSDQATEALFLGLPFTRWRAGERVASAEPLVTPNIPHP